MRPSYICVLLISICNLLTFQNGIYFMSIRKIVFICIWLLLLAVIDFQVVCELLSAGGRGAA